jgi:ribosomal protein L40E
MCGIAGYKAFGTRRPTVFQLKTLMSLLEQRGRDAAGFAFIDHLSKLRVEKAPMSSSKFAESKHFKLDEIPSMMIMHARAATVGSKKNNENNHPVVVDNTAVVHNGTIRNHFELFRDKKWKRIADVDSESVAHCLSNWWEDRVELNDLQGTFAIAALSQEHPQELILGRHSKPLEIFMDTHTDIMWFASVKDMLEQLYTKWHRGFPLTKPISSFQLGDDELLLIDNKGVAGTHEMIVKEYKPPVPAIPAATMQAGTPSITCDCCHDRAFQLHAVSYHNKSLYVCSRCYAAWDYEAEKTKKKKSNNLNKDYEYYCPHCMAIRYSARCFICDTKTIMFDRVGCEAKEETANG